MFTLSRLATPVVAESTRYSLSSQTFPDCPNFLWLFTFFPWTLNLKMRRGGSLVVMIMNFLDFSILMGKSFNGTGKCHICTVVANLQVGSTVFISPLRSIKNIDFKVRQVSHQDSIVLHAFKWRKNIVANFQESPLCRETFRGIEHNAGHCRSRLGDRSSISLE